MAVQTQQQYSTTTTTPAEACANYQQAVAQRDTANLNLQRATVRATVNSIVLNFGMRPGDYVNASTAVFAIRCHTLLPPWWFGDARDTQRLTIRRCTTL
jgi:multidrug resistance efflux pump